MQASRRLISAAALVSVSLCVAPASGEFSGKQLSLVGDPPKAATYDAGRAKLDVTVRNDSRYGGDLRVRLVPPPPKGVRLEGISGWTIEPRGVQRVSLQLRADDADKPPPVAGTLVISARDDPGLSPLAVPVSASGSGGRFADAKVEPGTVVVKVKSWLPHFAPRWLITDAQPVTVTGVGAGQAYEEGEIVATEPLSGDVGGRGSVLLLAAEDIPATKLAAVTLNADVRRVTREGESESELEPKVTIKVIAGDLFIWPLLALLAGAFLAYRKLESQEEGRPRELLRGALQTARESYAAAEAGVHDAPYTIHAFPDRPWDCDQTPKTPALQLWCDIGSATTQEKLDEHAKNVSDLASRVAAWPVMLSKARKLRGTADQLEGKPHADALREAIDELLLPKSEPADEPATTAYVKSLDGMLETVERWLAAAALLAEGVRLHDELVQRVQDPEDLRRVHEHNPHVWEPDLAAATSVEDVESCGMAEALCRDVHVLRAVAAAHPVRKEPKGLAPLSDVEAHAGELRTLGMEARIVRDETPDDRTAARIRLDVEAADRRHFWLTATITTLAYFLTIYDDTFGSVADYLGAFSAGAAGTLAINWKLLPFFRSYRAPKPA